MLNLQRVLEAPPRQSPLSLTDKASLRSTARGEGSLECSPRGR